MRWCPLLLLALSAHAQITPHTQLARDVFRELIEIDSTTTAGTGKAVAAIAARLQAAGFSGDDLQTLGPRPERLNLVARIRGAGAQKPVLFIGHIDTVDVKREDWSLDPFHFTEQGGFFYGRGAIDMKDDVANLVAAFINIRKHGAKPQRDLIMALTADEEAGGPDNGMQWLIQNHRQLIDAEYCINPDAGGGEARDGKKVTLEVQFSEKTYLSFRLESRDRGGHSSLPRKDNPIYHLADGLGRLERFDFPVMLSEGTRTYLERIAKQETPARSAAIRQLLSSSTPDPAAAAVLSKDAHLNAVLRTTCVATELAGGHAENALPQMARATVNCRILPWHAPAEVQRTLTRVIADPKVQITPIQEVAGAGSPPSPLRPDVMAIVKRITDSMWPGVSITPTMSTGATDGKYLRRAGIPTYGVSGVFSNAGDSRAHGRDERVGVQEFYDGADFMLRLIEAIGGIAAQ